MATDRAFGSREWAECCEAAAFARPCVPAQSVHSLSLLILRDAHWNRQSDSLGQYCFLGDSMAYCFPFLMCLRVAWAAPTETSASVDPRDLRFSLHFGNSHSTAISKPCQDYSSQVETPDCAEGGQRCIHRWVRSWSRYSNTKACQLAEVKCQANRCKEGKKPAGRHWITRCSRDSPNCFANETGQARPNSEPDCDQEPCDVMARYQSSN